LAYLVSIAAFSASDSAAISSASPPSVEVVPFPAVVLGREAGIVPFPAPVPLAAGAAGEAAAGDAGAVALAA